MTIEIARCASCIKAAWTILVLVSSFASNDAISFLLLCTTMPPRSTQTICCCGTNTDEDDDDDSEESEASVSSVFVSELNVDFLVC